MSAIEDNLAALELFPKQWISEIGDRIRVPVLDHNHDCRMALMWHRAGLSKKQIRKLLRHKNVSYWQVDRMIERAGKWYERTTGISS